MKAVWSVPLASLALLSLSALAESNCTDSQTSRFEIDAVKKSALSPDAHGTISEAFSSYVQRIERVSEKPATYRADTSFSDGSSAHSFLITVEGAENCDREHPAFQVTSFKEIPAVAVPKISATQTYASLSMRGGHSDGGGAPCSGEATSSGEISAILSSEKLKLAYENPVSYLSAWITNIQRIASGTYRVSSIAHVTDSRTAVEQTESREFEVHVFGGNSCYTDWATVDSVKGVQ